MSVGENKRKEERLFGNGNILFQLKCNRLHSILGFYLLSAHILHIYLQFTIVYHTQVLWGDILGLADDVGACFEKTHEKNKWMAILSIAMFSSKPCWPINL